MALISVISATPGVTNGVTCWAVIALLATASPIILHRQSAPFLTLGVFYTDLTLLNVKDLQPVQANG